MIYISKDLVKQIIEHSKKEFPNEACGILSGSQGRVDTSTSLSVNGERSRTVEKVYEMTNVDKSPETFFMDAKEQLRVMKEIRSKGEEMIGIYHSHVASPAYPSTHDIEMVFYPEVSYVIVSLKDKDNPVVRSFKIKEGRISEEELKIE